MFKSASKLLWSLICELLVWVWFYTKNIYSFCTEVKLTSSFHSCTFKLYSKSKWYFHSNKTFFMIGEIKSTAVPNKIRFNLNINDIFTQMKRVGGEGKLGAKDFCCWQPFKMRNQITWWVSSSFSSKGNLFVINHDQVNLQIQGLIWMHFLRQHCISSFMQFKINFWHYFFQQQRNLLLFHGNLIFWLELVWCWSSGVDCGFITKRDLTNTTVHQNIQMTVEPKIEENF